MRRPSSLLSRPAKALAPFLALVFLQCRAAPEAPPPAARHLVLVTIDTLRADRVGAYGSSSVATPNLDALAREGARALDASAPVPLTRPAHVSLLSGLYPAEHHIRDNVSPALGEEVPTLAERLKGEGFLTAGFVSAVVLSRQSGLARGFDTFSDDFGAGGGDERALDSIQRGGDVTTAEAVSWLEGRHEARTFVWLHLYDPHDPYDPPEPYASRYASQPYDGEVAWSDELVGRLDAALSRLGLKDQTLLVVTSDHGEGLGEHGEETHGYFIYESTLAVPLLLRGPGIRPGTELRSTVRSVDLVPTVLELLGLKPKGTTRLSGRSLAGALRGGAEPASVPTYAESLTPLLHYGWSDLRSLRDGRFKYILAPRPELYDLKTDPREERNLMDASPTQATALHAALLKRLAEEKTVVEALPAAAAAAVPPDMLEQLGALGYVGAGGAGSAAKTGADPKDKLEDYRQISTLMREGMTLLSERDPASAAARFQALVRRGIDSFEVHYYLARAFFDQRRPREAASHFETAIARLPGFGRAYVSLAICYAALGDSSRALATLRKGQAENPRDPQVLEAQGALLRDLKRPQEAIAAYEAARPLAPKNAMLRLKLAEMYRDGGRLDRAVELLREAVKINPEPAGFWNSLGVVLGASEKPAEAETAFRSALERDPGKVQYAYNLGLVLVRLQKKDEARAVFRRALEMDPGFSPARERLAELGREP